MRISIVVCTYNRGEQLMRTLRSIAAQRMESSSWEAIIVNNNSTDDTEGLFRQFIKQTGDAAANFRLVFEARQGLSHARNRGIELSRGEYIALVDDDEEINPDFAAQYAEFFDTHPDAAAAGGKIQPLYEYETPAWLSKWVERPISAAIDLGDSVKLFKGERYPIGGNMAFRREWFERCGVFDPELGRSGASLLSGEEKDLFRRIRSAGGKIYWVPGPRVLHLIPESRLTTDYLRRLTRMIGVSERRRTLRASRGKYVGRLFSEGVKWGGTLAIAASYLLSGHPSKAKYLIVMRYNITAGLLKREK